MLNKLVAACEHRMHSTRPLRARFIKKKPFNNNERERDDVYAKCGRGSVCTGEETIIKTRDHRTTDRRQIDISDNNNNNNNNTTCESGKK